MMNVRPVIHARHFLGQNPVSILNVNVPLYVAPGRPVGRLSGFPLKAKSIAKLVWGFLNASGFLWRKLSG